MRDCWQRRPHPPRQPNCYETHHGRNADRTAQRNGHPSLLSAIQAGVGADCLATVAAMAEASRSTQPTHVQWKNRRKGVSPMPGGYDGYFDSLRWTAESTQDAPASQSELAARMADHFGLTESAARYRLSFLKMVGFLSVDSGVWILPELIKRWLLDRDPAPLVLRLHDRVQFIGEMLTGLEKPMTTSDLRRWACDEYLMGWETNTQIDNRRGWLQSAGLMGRNSDGLLCLTDGGSGFLDLVVVEPSLDRPSGKHGAADGSRKRHGRAVFHLGADTPSRDLDAGSLDRAAQVSRRVSSAATDSKNPTQFELTVRDAFRYLGFAAEHLGGSGQTDVLVDARFGAEASYRVAIDAKTTSAPSLQDHQVDWDTLTEHRQKHEAHYSMLVGPNPAAGRLMERAQHHNVAVLSAEALAGLCELHSVRPLGLADYRAMFAQGGEVDLSEIEERAEQADRLVALAKRLIDAIADLARDLGPLTANQLRLTMYHQDSEDLPTEAEIAATLASLASPLMGAIAGNRDTGYVLACSPAVTAHRLSILGDTLKRDEDLDPGAAGD